MKKLDLGLLSNKQNKELIIFLILTIVIISLDFSFVLKSQWTNLLDMNQQLSQTRQKILKSDVDELRIDRLRERLEELSKTVTIAKQGIIEEGQIPTLMEKISKLADVVNLKIMQMIPQKEIRDSNRFSTSAGEEYYIQPISLIARGDYHSLGKFLNKLEAYQVLIALKTIDIIPGSSRAAMQHNVRLSVFIFVVKKV